MSYTQNEIDTFVKMFGTNEAAEALAKNFLEGMASSQEDMLSDDPDLAMPDDNDIYGMSVDFGTDMFEIFQMMVLNAMAKLKEQMTVDVMVTREVTIHINFDN